VRALKDAGLETSLKDEKFVVKVVRFQWMYEWLVCSAYIYFCRFGVVV